MGSRDFAAASSKFLWIDLNETSQTKRENMRSAVRKHIMLNHIAKKSLLDDHEQISKSDDSYHDKAELGHRARAIHTNKNHSREHGRVIKTSTFPIAPVLQHGPVAPETRLAAAMVSTLDKAHAGETWFGVVPSRIGYSKAVDLAAQAFIHSVAGTPDTASRRPYLGAMGALRKLMRTPSGARSDDALLTVALLTSFELISESSVLPILSHIHGLQAILLARASICSLVNTKSNELTWVILHAFRVLVFTGPVARGIPSPFKPQLLRAVGRFNRDVQPGCIEAMQTVIFRMYSGLPRLIVAMRKAQEDPHCSKVRNYASRLAEKLLLVGSPASENDFLHRIHVHQNDDSAAILSTSWSFASITAWETGVLYWAYHILLFRICYRLSNSLPTSVITGDKLAMKADAARMCRNIIMSSRFGEETGEYITMIVPIIAVWGTVADFDDLSMLGVPTTDKLRPWALRWASKLSGSNMSRPQLVRKLNESADVCVGGPLPDNSSRDHAPPCCVPIPTKSPQHITTETKYSRASRLCWEVIRRHF